MRHSHPVHSVDISSDIIGCLLEEFDGIINSKRLRSQINKIGELIDVLWKRNTFNTNQDASNTISKYLPTTQQREIVKDYIGILNHNANNNNEGNIYAKIRQESLNRSTQPASEVSPNQPASANIPQSASSHSSTASEGTKRRHDIFRIVCDNIDKWRDFGRSFDMRDAELTHISQGIQDDIKAITNRILEQMETKHGDQFHQKLCDALTDARRKDIVRILKKNSLI